MSAVPPPGRALVTGSSAGIGAEVARQLELRGWHVVRHARSPGRAEDCHAAAGRRVDVVVGDLATLAGIRDVAGQAWRSGPFDAVVHNAGWAATGSERQLTEDGLERTFAVNAAAPYLLTCLLPVAPRLVYLSSDATRGVRVDLDDLQHSRSYDPGHAYAASKVVLTAVALLVARRRPDVVSNAVHPGWVRTAMSDDRAPLDVTAGADTAVWLAEGIDADARVSGRLLHERRAVRYAEQAHDPAVQDALAERLEELTGAALPAGPGRPA